MNNKNILRKNIRALRENLTDEYISTASKIIFENLIKLDFFMQAKNILSYIDFKNEVQTSKINNFILSQNKNLYFPRVIDKEKMIPIKHSGNFDKSKIGNLEPIGEEYIGDIDLVIVPGVVFDRNGNRIGFGRGYYDRFLEKYPNSKKIAVAFDIQLSEEEIIVDEFDKKMDIIITNKETLFFNNL